MIACKREIILIRYNTILYRGEGILIRLKQDSVLLLLSFTSLSVLQTPFFSTTVAFSLQFVYRERRNAIQTLFLQPPLPLQPREKGSYTRVVHGLVLLVTSLTSLHITLFLSHSDWFVFFLINLKSSAFGMVSFPIPLFFIFSVF